MYMYSAVTLVRGVGGDVEAVAGGSCGGGGKDGMCGGSGKGCGGEGVLTWVEYLPPH